MTLFWMPGQLGEVDLDAQVAAGDHDGVGSGQDAVDVIDALAVLDLGDDADVGVVLVQQVADVVDVLCGCARKEAAMKSKPCWDTEDDVIPVALAQVGHDRWTPGTLTPFLVLILPLLSTSQTMSVSVTLLMASLMRPSSSMMVPPSWTSWGRSL